MGVVSPGGETVRPEAGKTDLVQPGLLIESMQTELHRLLKIEEAFSAIKRRQEFQLSGSVDLDVIMGVVEEVQQSSEAGIPSRMFEFLEPGTHLSQRSSSYAKAGCAAFLLSVKDRLLERERQTWADGPVAQGWLGSSAILRRPPAAVTSNDDNWGSQGVLYRGYEGGEYISGHVRDGDRADFKGEITKLSLEQSGVVYLSYGGDSGVEITEIFEPIEDSDNGIVSGYVPRVSIKTVTEAASKAD